MGKSIFTRILIGLCIVAQFAATTPHHHHQGSEVVCYNGLHLFMHNVHDRCGDDSHHHDTPFTACSVKLTVLAQPERIEQSQSAVEWSVPSESRYADFNSVSATHHIDLTVDMTRVAYRSVPDVIPVLMEYIPRALSARAPNCRA